MAQKQRRKSIPVEEFIRAWQEGTSVGQVATELYGAQTRGADALRMSLSTRAAVLRKKGIPLKIMPNSGRGKAFTEERVDELSQLALKLMEK